MDLRYGENPHQKAALLCFYYENGAMKDFIQHQGRNCLLTIYDMDVAWKVVQEFEEEIACCGLKHSTPCGVAIGKLWRKFS